MTPREKRLAIRLIAGPVTREEADRAAKVSNGPAVVAQLRHKYGLTIPCQRVDCADADGRPSYYGVYSATPDDRRWIVQNAVEVD